MFIPRFLISAATFPGVIVHEIAHHFFCDLAKVPVYKVVYYQMFSPFGSVKHAEVPDLKTSLLITVGPFIVCTFLCAVLTLPWGLLNHMKSLMALLTWFNFLQIWLGLSIGMHALPSQEELDDFHKRIKLEASGPLWVVATWLRLCFILARMGRFFWFDAIYAVFIALITPFMLCW